MVTIRGQQVSSQELLAKVASMPPRAVARNVAEIALTPIRRGQTALVPRVSSARWLHRRLGFSSRAELAEHFRGPAFALWPLQPSSAPGLRDALLATCPGVREDAVARADRAAAHVVDLLGTGPVHLGDDIDWLTDVKTGRRWPPAYYRSIDYTNLDQPSDVKVVWEISRSHHLVDLARGHLLTGDPRYVRELTAQWSSWLAANPYGGTVNWSCTMDVAIRAVNWIWALSVVSPELDEAVLAEVVASLFQHGQFTARNLEKSEVNGNHYVADAAGLVALGAFFHRWPQGRQWLRQGEAILLEEMPRQVYPDGVDHEMSIPYHRLVAEMFMFAFVLMRRAGRPVPERHWSLLERMGEFTAAYTRPDGSAPVVGDADDGRLHRFGSPAINDHRALLQTFALLFDRADFVSVASDQAREEVLWLLGPTATSRLRPVAAGPPPPRATAFRDGGFVVLRSSTSHLVMDAGPVGLQGRGGHGHNDALSLELWVGGGPLVVDPGSYVYTSDPAARNRFRSTASHNTPMRDGAEIARLGDDRNLWFLGDDAQARLDEVRQDASSATAVAHHVGYSRLVPGVRVVRSVVVDDHSCTVRDGVPFDGAAWTVGWTLSPETNTTQVDAQSVLLERDGRMTVTYTVEGARTLRVVQAMTSPSYGIQLPTRRILVEWPGGELVSIFSCSQDTR